MKNLSLILVLFFFSEIGAMSYIKQSTESSRKESLQIMKELRKTERNINELLTKASTEKPPLLPESRPIYYFSLILQITSSMRVEINQFPTKNTIVMRILIPHFRRNHFVPVREAILPYLHQKIGEKEPLSGIFMRKDLILEPKMDIDILEENAAESFGCDWYDTKLKCMSPNEFNNLISSSFFPRKSSLSYKRRES